MHVGRGYRQAMDQAALIVHSHVELHAEVPLVSLPGLLHLWISFSFPVLRRAGRFNDAGIHNRPFPEDQPCFCQMLLDALKQHLGQPVTLQQMAEVQNRRLLRYLLQADTGKTSHALNLTLPNSTASRPWLPARRDEAVTSAQNISALPPRPPR